MKNISSVDLHNLNNLENGMLELFYKGPMDEHAITSLGNTILEITHNCNEAQNNTFKVFMELIQNVSYYSLDKQHYKSKAPVGKGIMLISKEQHEYFLHVGNIVSTKDIAKVTQKCEKINQLSREELRKFKRQEIAKPFSSSGGGNIGLIMISLNTNSPIDYKLTTIDENKAFFSICVKIKCN